MDWRIRLGMCFYGMMDRMIAWMDCMVVWMDCMIAGTNRGLDRIHAVIVWPASWMDGRTTRRRLRKFYGDAEIIAVEGDWFCIRRGQQYAIGHWSTLLYWADSLGSAYNKGLEVYTLVSLRSNACMKLTKIPGHKDSGTFHWFERTGEFLPDALKMALEAPQYENYDYPEWRLLKKVLKALK